MKKNIKQSDINKIWSDVWKKQKSAELREVFNHYLFIEGYKVFKKYILNTPGQNILEIGTGSGRYGLRIARDFKSSNILLTDIADESLEMVISLSLKLNLENVRIKKEDVFKLSFLDESFDLVFCDVVIQHLPEYQTAVKEMVRVLKPGGRIIISTVNYWNLPHTFFKFLSGDKYMYGYEKSYKKRDLREMMCENNLSVIGEDGFYFAYSIFRLTYMSKIFKILGKFVNRIIKIIDLFTNRFISKNFGFVIFVVGQKN